MSRNNLGDAWALESEEPQPNGEEVNPDQSKQGVRKDRPAEVERDSWALENCFTNIVIENIIPQTSPESRWKLIWRIIGHALVTYKTRAEIDRFILGWDEKNNPKVGTQSLLGKIDWALTCFPSKLRGTA